MGLAGVERIELPSAVLETAVLPLNDTPRHPYFTSLSRKSATTRLRLRY